MRRGTIRVIIGLSSLLTVATQAALNSASFPFVRTVTPPAALHSEIGSFVLDDVLFDALDDHWGNLRLFDSNDHETPFLIRRKAPQQTVEQLVPFPSPLKIESLQEREGNRIELKVARDPGQPQPAALEFGSGIRNFEKVVTVSGSRDGVTWVELARDEPIYDYSRFAAVRRDRIPLNAGDYTTYKIELSNITEKKDSPLVEIIRQTRSGGESNEVEATSFRREPFRIDQLAFYELRQTLTAGIGETDAFAMEGMTCLQNEKQQVTMLEFSTRREPLSAITLLTDDANFSREVTLEGRTDEPPATWHEVARDRIYRIRVGKVKVEHLVLVFPAETRYRSYRLTVHNQDNPPLTMTGLLARRNLHEVLFFPHHGQTYRVSWGGEAVAAPRYDIGTVLSGVPAGSADVWQLGVVQHSQGGFPPQTWSFYSRKMMIGALVVMAGILIVVVIRLARKVDLQ